MKVKSYCIVILFFCIFLNSCKLNDLPNESIDDDRAIVGLSLMAQSRVVAKNKFVLEGYYGEGCKKSSGSNVWKLFGGDRSHEKSLSISNSDINCKIYLTKLNIFVNNINNKYNVINNGKNRYILSENFSKNFLEIKKIHNSLSSFDDKLFLKVKLTKGDLSSPPTIHLELRRMKEFDYSIQGKNIVIDYTKSKSISELAGEAIYRVYPFGKGVYALGYKNRSDISQGGLFYTSDFLKNEFKKVDSIQSNEVSGMVFDSDYIYVANFSGGGGLYYAPYQENLNFKKVQDRQIKNEKIRKVAVSGRNIYVVSNDNSLYFTTQGVNGAFKKVDIMNNEKVNGLYVDKNKVIITTAGKNIYFSYDLTSGIFHKNEYGSPDTFINEIIVAKNAIILGGKNGIYISKNGIEGKFIPQQELRDNEIYNLFLQDNEIYASIMCSKCAINQRNNMKFPEINGIVHSDGIYFADLNADSIKFERIASVTYPMSFTLFNDKALISTPSGLAYYEDSN